MVIHDKLSISSPAINSENLGPITEQPDEFINSSASKPEFERTSFFSPENAIKEYKKENPVTRILKNLFGRNEYFEQALKKANPLEVYKLTNPVSHHMQEFLYKKNPSWASQKYQKAKDPASFPVKETNPVSALLPHQKSDQPKETTTQKTFKIFHNNREKQETEKKLATVSSAKTLDELQQAYKKLEIYNQEKFSESSAEKLLKAYNSRKEFLKLTGLQNAKDRNSLSEAYTQIMEDPNIDAEFEEKAQKIYSERLDLFHNPTFSSLRSALALKQST